MAKKPTCKFLDDALARFPRETVEVPELGMTIEARGLSARDMMALAEAAAPSENADQSDDAKLGIAVMVRSLYDLDGNRLIPAGREDDITKLPHLVFQRLMEATNRVNGTAPPADAEPDTREIPTGDQ